jgi:hypothetical protein
MEKIIHKLINEFIEGVDTYTHNDSVWLIFTESKQWVIELTENKTLWYNYTFFQEIFIYASLDVVENQQYITKWVEDNIINKVSYTEIAWHNNIDDTLKNGVKRTFGFENFTPPTFDDALKNGVKETITSENRSRLTAENIIENGIKETFDSDWDVPTDLIEDITTDGIKKTKTPGEDGDIVGVLDFMTEHKINSIPKLIDNVINDGIKTELMWIKWDNHLDEVYEKNIKETNSWNESIIGDLNQYGCIDAVIKEGVKETKSIGKESPNYPTPIINHIIINGVKETKGDASQNPMGKVTNVIKEGIKNPTY